MLDAHLRFTLRAQAGPTIWWPCCSRSAMPAPTDVERLALWAEPGGRRLDPLALLDAAAR